MNCNLCPIECGAKREEGEKGACGAGGQIKAARAALHYWEEPCISGDSGSGAVFFSGCQMQCVFCQNAEISRGTAGLEISAERLAEIFCGLMEKGARNINLVTPTPYVNEIIKAVKRARADGMNLPIIYNTSGYEKAETLKMLEGIVDVYLPDLKYMQNDEGKRYSGIDNYCDFVFDALDEMYRQTGKCRFDGDGYILKGMIVRHLVLPGMGKTAEKAVDYLMKRFGNGIYISLMSQYTPFGNLSEYPELQKTVEPQEYEKIVAYATNRGLENGFIQEGTAADESFIPPFDYEGIRKDDQ